VEGIRPMRADYRVVTPLVRRRELTIASFVFDGSIRISRPKGRAGAAKLMNLTVLLAGFYTIGGHIVVAWPSTRLRTFSTILGVTHVGGH
jgi:hypothetical protein